MSQLFETVIDHNSMQLSEAIDAAQAAARIDLLVAAVKRAAAAETVTPS